MKKLLILSLSIILLLTSCSSEKDFYGVWFVEKDGMRDVIQFSESADGKNAFIWAVYDIQNDELLSVSKGYYKADGKGIVFTYLEGNTDLTLTYKLEGSTLSLNSETAFMVLSKYE